jgi:hypothetical protein
MIRRIIHSPFPFGLCCFCFCIEQIQGQREKPERLAKFDRCEQTFPTFKKKENSNCQK